VLGSHSTSYVLLREAGGRWLTPLEIAIPPARHHLGRAGLGRPAGADPPHGAPRALLAPDPHEHLPGDRIRPGRRLQAVAGLLQQPARPSGRQAHGAQRGGQRGRSRRLRRPLPRRHLQGRRAHLPSAGPHHPRHARREALTPSGQVVPRGVAQAHLHGHRGARPCAGLRGHASPDGLFPTCPEPLSLPEAGHFAQEQGDAVARAAPAHFATPT
jgi:hypothetical protein